MILLDTHVLIWLMDDDPRLGGNAARLIEHERQTGVILSIMSLWEIAMLAEKGRLNLKQDVREWIDDVLSLDGVHSIGLDLDIVVAANRLPGDFHKDPADRLIVATAIEKNLKLVSADRAIIAYGALGAVEVVDARA